MVEISFMDKFQWAVVVFVGCGSAQTLIYLIIAKMIPDGIWRKDPGYLAHQAVTFPMMVFMGFYGVYGWIESVMSVTTVTERVYGPNDAGQLLSQVALGFALFDLPCSLIFKSMRKADAIAHHAAMASLAFGVCTPVCSFYVPLFFGVIELSSVPLTVAEIFHPDHFPEFATMYPTMEELNEKALRPAFALLFLLLRGLYLPFVMASMITPDMLTVAAAPDSAHPFLVYFLCGLGWFLISLQAYWSTLIVRQVIKVLKKDKEKDKANEVEAREANFDEQSYTLLA